MPPLFDIFGQGCDACELKKHWPALLNPKMPIASPEEPSLQRVLLLGEAPGETEDQEGIPFVGKTGQYLRNHIPREWQKKFYITNMCRCRPPSNRPPTEREIFACTTAFLEPDLLKLRPHAILAIGDIALSYFFPSNRISQMRGITCTVRLNDESPVWFSSTFHPSYVTRQERELYEGKSVNPVEPVFRNDLEKFFRRVPWYAENKPYLPTVPKGKVLYPKSAQEALNLFSRLKEPFGKDIETSKLKPHERDAAIVTAAFSDGDLTFAIPVDWPGMLHKWGISAYDKMMRSGREWIAHNAAFELIWAWAKTGEHRQRFQDPMVLARLSQQRANEHRKGGLLSLEALSNFHLGVNIKSLTRVDSGRLLEFPLEEVLEYNAYDAWGCYELYQYFMRFGNLTKDDLENYQRSLRTIKSVVAMQLFGLPVDLEESAKQYEILSAQEKELTATAASFPEVKQYKKDTGKQFLLSSPQVVARVLTQYCKVNLPKSASGNYMTDDDVLDKYLDDHALVQLVLDSREVKTLKTRYVSPILNQKFLGADFLLHPEYSVTFTNTWRLSSENPNAQNWPKRKNRQIRRQIIPPKGFIIASFDYGQLEARVLVMASGDNNLREAFINHDDIHSKWLKRIIKLYPPYLDRLAQKTGQTEEKEIIKAGRDIVKTDFVFASFYGSIPTSVANRAMIPLEITNELYREFWGEYYLVKKWIDSQRDYYNEKGQVKSLTNRIRNEVIRGNEFVNTPIQGTGSEIVLEAQCALTDLALETDEMFEVLPRINIHDDLCFFMRDCSALGDMLDLVAQEIVKPRFNFITVPLLTEGKIGDNWSDLEKVGTWEGSYFRI